MPAITIAQKRYQLLFVRARKVLENDGLCDPPNTPNPEIWIYYRLQGIKRLTIIIHELMHAAVWCLGEESILKGAEYIARALEAAGVEEGGEPAEEVREVIFCCLRMVHLQLDIDGWAERTADEIAVVLGQLGYGI